MGGVVGVVGALGVVLVDVPVPDPVPVVVPVAPLEPLPAVVVPAVLPAPAMLLGVPPASVLDDVCAVPVLLVVSVPVAEPDPQALKPRLSTTIAASAQRLSPALAVCLNETIVSPLSHNMQKGRYYAGKSATKLAIWRVNLHSKLEALACCPAFGNLLKKYSFLAVANVFIDYAAI